MFFIIVTAATVQAFPSKACCCVEKEFQFTALCFDRELRCSHLFEAFVFVFFLIIYIYNFLISFLTKKKTTVPLTKVVEERFP